MTLVFPGLILIAALASWPAFQWSKRKGPESRWLMFLAVPGVVVWLSLTLLGFGAQSLSNLVEVIWLVGASVVLSYLKLLLPARSSRVTTYVLLVVLAAAAILLRALTPVFPE